LAYTVPHLYALDDSSILGACTVASDMSSETAA